MNAYRPATHPIALVWLRRDLRLDDHAALALALRESERVHCCFVFDEEILAPLPRADRRVEFIWEALREIDSRLRALGGALWTCHDAPERAIPMLARLTGAEAVYANHDYEPAAIARDKAVAASLAAEGRELVTCKDQVVFECAEVLTQDGRPFSVFTPYKRAWLKKLDPEALAEHAVHLEGRLATIDRPRLQPAAQPLPEISTTGAAPARHWQAGSLPTLEALGFEPAGLADLNIRTGASGAQALFDDFSARIAHYRDTRDYPAVKGPSYLSVHLRFGTISVRQLARFAWHTMQTIPLAAAGAETWLSELIWRDFYFQILWHHPRVVGAAFRPEYDLIRWVEDDALFATWCEGRTGYPLVDAAMAQINRTGYMHNRLRMVVASFLMKDLGIDWRKGERYFAQHLIDFDLAANNGGWQWAASSGCDAQPYFRIFNPVTQSERFDPQGKFIRRYLPQLARLPDKALHAPWLASPTQLAAAGIRLGLDYPKPVVVHDEARKATLERYAAIKGGDTPAGG